MNYALPSVVDFHHGLQDYLDGLGALRSKVTGMSTTRLHDMAYVIIHVEQCDVEDVVRWRATLTGSTVGFHFHDEYLFIGFRVTATIAGVEWKISGVIEHSHRSRETGIAEAAHLESWINSLPCN